MSLFGKRPKLKPRRLLLERLEDRLLLSADPVAAVVAPGEGFINEDFRFSVSFDNTGADVGYAPFLDVVTPVGLDVNSATVVGGPAESEVVGEPLDIRATAGFKFGDTTPVNDPPPIGTDPPVYGPQATSPVVPTVLTLSKAAATTEGGTVTGPNFPVTYSINVDIANLETVDNIEIRDVLPSNLVGGVDQVLFDPDPPGPVDFSNPPVAFTDQRCGVQHHIRGHYPSFIAHTGSCARPNPSPRLWINLLRRVFAGCRQSLLGDGPSRRYLCNPYERAWTPT